VLGANDGASGVAVLLEIARVFGTIPPQLGVEIVLFDGEDAGRSAAQESYCRGSQGYVQQMEHPRPIHAVIVDMVGRRGTQIHREGNSDRAAKNLVDRIWNGARKVKANSFVDQPRYFVYDDHVPFIQAGIPAVDVIDLDDPFWHTTQDDVAHCDPASLGDVGRALLWHVYTLELDLP
jgi:Zn-dependent M28 family amino/carboxypeptidase